MPSHSLKEVIFAVSIATSLSGCGTVVPQIVEPWEGRDIDSKMSYFIKKSIFCEVAEAIDEANRKVHFEYPGRSLVPAIPDDYGVQMQTTLTVEENTSINPSVSYGRTFRNSSESGVALGQSFNLGVGASLSATATRIDTTFSYWLVGKIAHGAENEYCHDGRDPIIRTGSSPLLKSDLGIRDYLISSVEAAVVLHSSKPEKAKSLKLDVYSYQIKFAVLTNGNINPTWKLVPISSGGGTPLYSTGRTRTHELLITFGPNGDQGLQPSVTALNQHLAAQINSTLRGP